MSQIILIPHLKVQNANLQTSGFILGGAPLMAAAMFCHNLARQLNTQDLGFILVHHDRQDIGGTAYGRFTPAQRRGAVFVGKKDYSSKNKYALSLQPTASCHLEISLIVDFGRVRQMNRLVNRVQQSRFAGGQIISVGELVACDSTQQALEQLRNGFVLQDRKALLQHYQQQHQLNRVQALVQLLAHKPDTVLPEPSLPESAQRHFSDPEILEQEISEQEILEQKLSDPDFSNTDLSKPQPEQKLSWLSATTLGYALLEQPTTQRTGVRQADTSQSTATQPTAHAYAEPLIGLIQYQSLRVVQQVKDSTQLEQLYWRYGWPQSDVFLLQQQTNP